MLLHVLFPYHKLNSNPFKIVFTKKKLLSLFRTIFQQFIKDTDYWYFNILQKEEVKSK